MQTEYICTDADVGRSFPISDGYLISLIQTQPPAGDAHARPWGERHLVLHDTRSPRALFCMDFTIARAPPLVIGSAKYWLANSNIRYFGELQIVCMPTGAQFEVIISDIPVTPRAPIKMGFWYGNPVPRGPSSIIAPPPYMPPPLLVAGG